MEEEVIFQPSWPVKPHAPDRWPVYRTIAYTLSISWRFLWSCAVGNGTLARADELIDWYWRKIYASGSATLTATGRKHFLRGQPHVVMSNHTSLLDIPSMMGTVPGTLRMVTKEELCRIPIWGQALVASGFIPINRRSRQRAIAQLEKAKQMLRQGVNVWIAPEGTRSRTGELLPFKKGGFHTAIDLGVPIIPTWIEGAYTVIPPDQFIVKHGGKVCVHFGKPIQTAGLTKDDVEPLMAEVRRAMLELSAPRQAARDDRLEAAA